MSFEKQKQAKKGVDLQERSDKRRDLYVSLRKKNIEQEIKKQRGIRPEESGPGAADLPATPLPQLVQELNSADTPMQLNATIQIRKLLSAEKNPPIDPVIQTGAVLRLVEFLRRADCAELQFEAAWALTNIASGTSEHTMCIISSGAVPIFIELLGSPSENVREQSVWALGNIAGDSAKCRDLILNLNVMEPLLKIITLEPTIQMLRNVTWTLSNLCRGKPIPDFAKVLPCLPVLAKLVFHFDEEVLTDACWAISYLSDGPNERIEEVLNTNVHPRLIAMLDQQDSAIMTPALRTIGNMVTGNDHQTQTLIAGGILPRIHYLLQHPKKTIRKECCWAISNITAGSQDQIQAVINAALIPMVIKLLSASEYEVRKEAGWAISNACSGGTNEQVKYMVQQGCIPPLCELLGVPDARVINVALDALEHCLRVGEEEREAGGGTDNVIVRSVSECGGLDRIEALQVHPNNDVYEHAISIIEQFFEVEDEIDPAMQDVEPAAPGPFQFQAPPVPAGHADPMAPGAFRF